jgi:hypothetical protein
MIYEQATFFGRRAIKTPLMEAVRREAIVIGHERKQRLDELRTLLASRRGDFAARSAWRAEMIKLLSEYCK